MKYVKGEICIVDSNGSIVVSDVVNSTIQIGTNADEIKAEIDNIISRISFQAINIILVTLVDTENDLINEWKPFGNKTIKQLLQECIVNFNAKGCIININYNDVLKSETIDAYLSYIKNQAIVIVDSDILNENHLEDFAKKFDDYSTGGIITINNGDELGTIDRVNDLFQYIQIYRNEFPGKIDTDHIRLNIQSEADFINNFCAICRKKFATPAVNFGIDPKVGLTSIQF